jgi:hypothetical protein
MPVLSYQVNQPGYGGVNPRLAFIFTDDPISVVTAPNYIDWLANQQGIYTSDVAIVVTRESKDAVMGAGFYEFVRIGTTNHWLLVPQSNGGGGQVLTWLTVTQDTQMAKRYGYISDGANIDFTLPTQAQVGDQVIVLGRGGNWTIKQNSGQTIFFGNVSTTPGIAGSLSSINANDSISLICRVENTEWSTFPPPQGNITFV